MSEIHPFPSQFNTGVQCRSAFVTPTGAIYRPAAQGGVQRLTPLALALMGSAGPVACWRIEAQREG